MGYHRLLADVVVLLSDGEELGRLGAELFAHEHPSFTDIDCFVNLEAAGNGGPARLIQVGTPNGVLVERLAHVVPTIAASSIAEELFELLPNTTDFQVFDRAGKSGYDIALVAGAAAYHAPDDLVEHLDPRSVQHMGDLVLALVRSLAEREVRAADARHDTFFDVGGVRLVHYARPVDALVGVAAALLCG
ncbi:MAG: M28 family peptidase [bacterium]|nr:M28 family peptidase [bacterium]